MVKQPTNGGPSTDVAPVEVGGDSDLSLWACLSELDSVLFDFRTIRESLLVGLDSYGEIERLADAQSSWPELPHKDLRVLRPTASADTVSEFAAALRILLRVEKEAVDAAMRKVWALECAERSPTEAANG